MQDQTIEPFTDRNEIDSGFSSALANNLLQTQSTAEIPDEQRILMEVTEPWYGVHQRITNYLEELNHPYVNLELSVAELRRVALGDLYYYTSSERAEEAIAAWFQIWRELYTRPLSSSLAGELLSINLDFIDRLLENADNGWSEDAVAGMLKSLIDVAARQTAWWARASTLLRRLHKRMPESGPVIDAYAVLVREVWRGTYRSWRNSFRAAGWYEENRHLFSPGSDLSASLSCFSPERFDQLLEDVEAAEGVGDLLALPDYASLADSILAVTEEIGEPVDQAQYLLYLLGNRMLAEQELWILARLVRCLQVIGRSDPTTVNRFIERFFGLLANHHFEEKDLVLNCVLALGKELHRRGDDGLLDTFVDRLVRFPFEAPNVQGVSDEWEVQVNPNHLPNVRLFMRLVGQDTTRYRRLLSALIVQLALHGFFVADTDLFQRDVSDLLNGDIRPLYHKVKQLARLFPVYFNEIGAEGELRDASTEIDEIQHRHDPLIHFFRKQVHVESNVTQVDMARDLILYWATGEKARLTRWLPAEVFQAVQPEGPLFEHVHALVAGLADRFGLPDFLELDRAELTAEIESMEKIPAKERRRVFLLLSLYKLLEQKYSFGVADALIRVENSRLVPADRIARLVSQLAEEAYPGALTATLDIMDGLKAIILDPKPTEADERIYRKRHVAAGIPSLYGVYREPKFEALGLTFRLEVLARRLYGKIVGAMNLHYVTKTTLNEVAQLLVALVRALEIDGMALGVLRQHLEMLEMGLQARDCSVDQYVNIFQFIAADVGRLTEQYVLRAHAGTAEVILAQSLPTDMPASEREQQAHMQSEKLMRQFITVGFGLQELDDLVGKVLMALTFMRGQLDRAELALLMSYDPHRLISPVHGEPQPHDNPFHLGSKGYYLKQMYLHGMPVPEGFIVTTERFRCQTAMSFGPLEKDTDERLRAAVAELERQCGAQFGDPANPLLLSVRSGAVMSMPGMMSTLLNVGINDEIAEALGKQERTAWAVWDCYRRLLQSWAMSHGVVRDVFDQAIESYKARYGVEKKMSFTPAQMREIAYHYKQVMQDHGVTLVEEPFAQLLAAIRIVLTSWFSQRAASYREHLGIAEQWGTAAIVQRMVLGNLNLQSGSGVVLTRDPFKAENGIVLYGDYNVCSQGEDVVSGLINPLPISEVQRSTRWGAVQKTGTLETDFPAIFRRLEELAHLLVVDKGYPHQEIEFTFESEDPADLYILQTRNMAYTEQERARVFVASEELKAKLLGSGMGAGGGALSGRLAFTEADIQALKAESPECPVVVVRPDTVPDDFALIAQADGLLTARGGCTSHAAVAAHRLGKTCVVNCRVLRVYDERRVAELDGRLLRFGDWISIDGRQGTIYQGKFATDYEHIIT